MFQFRKSDLVRGPHHVQSVHGTARSVEDDSTMDLTELACRDGISFLLKTMVTDYKQVMRDRTTGSEIFGA